jgi:hypothetical protein
MANQRDLKAFVRYDGSGRVVAGSLVLRKKKPKVGRWEEILTYECCNDAPITSTTTTTQNITQWSASVWEGYVNACTNSPGSTNTVYTADNTIGIGTTLWENSQLTIPYSPGIDFTYVKFAGNTTLYVFSQSPSTNTTIINTDTCE